MNYKITVLCISSLLCGLQADPAIATKKSLNSAASAGSKQKPTRAKKQTGKNVKAETVSAKYTKAEHVEDISQKNAIKPLDSIVKVIYTDHDPIIITAGMLTRKSLDGRARTEREIVIDHLIFDQAVNLFHMTPARSEAFAHIDMLKNQHHLSQQNIENLFKDAGMTYDDGLDELTMFYTNRNFLYHLMNNKVTPTQKEIEAYYTDHQEIVPASVKIQKAFIAKDDIPEAAIQQLKMYGIGQDYIMWDDPYSIDIKDLVESKQVLAQMNEGTLTVFDGGTEWEVVRVLKQEAERIRTLEESVKSIIEVLQYQKYEKILEEYKTKLLSDYGVKI